MKPRVAAHRLNHLVQQLHDLLLLAVGRRITACRLRSRRHRPGKKKQEEKSCGPHPPPTSTAPPLTFSTSPLMKPAQGVQRNRIGAAISSTCPTRPSGI